MMNRLPIPLVIAALGLFVLPPVLLALGLTMTSASEVVIFALACMALNILVGHTGLVSFGHGAWFGLAAYAAALIQRNLMPDSFFGPAIGGVLIVMADRPRLRLPDPAPARRVFLAADAGAGGDAVCGGVPLDRRHRRRERPRRHHAADAVRRQSGILHQLLLVRRRHRLRWC